MNISVILPAAGLGRRFSVGEGSGVRAASSKIEFELGHKPVFLRTVELFRNRGFASGEVGQILLAVNPDKLDDFKFRWGEQLDFQGVTLVPGGAAERWETVQLALEHVADEATHVAVHDAARPCASQAMIDRVFAAAEQFGAAVPGLAMGDTVKSVERESGEVRVERESGEGELPGALDALFGAEVSSVGQTHRILETVSRAGLFRVQTPQVFEKGLITAAYGQLNAENAEGSSGGITDDASVAERAGHAVFIVEGDPLNLKLTHPADAELLEAVLKMREEKDAKDAALQQLFGDDDDD